MLEPHPPHATPHTWRDFLLHIATIVVGLLIAVGIEQTVEATHHHHQVAEFQRQVQETFENNLRLDKQNLQRITAWRGYLAEVQKAARARRLGHPLPHEPAPDDARMKGILSIPSLAPYDAAKQDGTVALLSSEEIRLYNRIALQREFFMGAVQELFHDSRALEAFEQRFTNSEGSIEMGDLVLMPDLATLPPADLLQYETLLAAEIKALDLFLARDRRFDLMCRAVLNGARDENQLLEKARQAMQSGSDPAVSPESAQ